MGLTVKQYCINAANIITDTIFSSFQISMNKTLSNKKINSKQILLSLTGLWKQLKY